MRKKKGLLETSMTLGGPLFERGLLGMQMESWPVANIISKTRRLGMPDAGKGTEQVQRPILLFT